MINIYLFYSNHDQNFNESNEFNEDFKVHNTETHDLKESIDFNDYSIDSMHPKHTLSGKLVAFNQKSDASPNKRNGNNNTFLTKQLEKLNNFLNNISTQNNLPISKIEDEIDDEKSSTPYSECEFDAFESESVPYLQNSNKNLDHVETNLALNKIPSNNGKQDRSKIPRNFSNEFQKPLKGIIRVTSDYFNQDGDHNNDPIEPSSDDKNRDNSNTDTIYSKNLNRLFKSTHSYEVDDSSDNMSDSNKISVCNIFNVLTKYRFLIYNKDLHFWNSDIHLSINHFLNSNCESLIKIKEDLESDINKKIEGLIKDLNGDYGKIFK